MRCAELLAKGVGSELFDYLCAPVCLRPLGFDPMLDVMSLADAARALTAAAGSDARGVFNVPGKDVLPLSALIARAGRRTLPLPGGLLTPLYRLRARARGSESTTPATPAQCARARRPAEV
jgi:UDP-glucose 4-epimerase